MKKQKLSDYHIKMIFMDKEPIDTRPISYNISFAFSVRHYDLNQKPFCFQYPFSQE